MVQGEEGEEEEEEEADEEEEEEQVTLTRGARRTSDGQLASPT